MTLEWMLRFGAQAFHDGSQSHRASFFHALQPVVMHFNACAFHVLQPVALDISFKLQLLIFELQFGPPGVLKCHVFIAACFCSFVASCLLTLLVVHVLKFRALLPTLLLLGLPCSGFCMLLSPLCVATVLALCRGLPHIFRIPRATHVTDFSKMDTERKE